MQRQNRDSKSKTKALAQSDYLEPCPPPSPHPCRDQPSSRRRSVGGPGGRTVGSLNSAERWRVSTWPPLLPSLPLSRPGRTSTPAGKSGTEVAHLGLRCRPGRVWQPQALLAAAPVGLAAGHSALGKVAHSSPCCLMTTLVAESCPPCMRPAARKRPYISPASACLGLEGALQHVPLHRERCSHRQGNERRRLHF